MLINVIFLLLIYLRFGCLVPSLGVNFGSPFMEIIKDQGVMFVTGAVGLIRSALISFINQLKVFFFNLHMSS